MKNCTKKGTSQSIDLTTLYQTQLSKDLESLAKKQKIHLQDKEQLMLKLIQNTTDNLSEDDDDPNDSLSIKPLFKQSIWKTRFTLPFLKCIENSQNLITLITELLILADGHFNSGFISYIEIKKLNRFQGYFVFTQKNISLSFEIGTVIVPNKKASRINHVMTFIDIKFERKSFEELYDSTQQYHNSLKFDRQQLCSFKDIKLEQQIIVQKKDRTQYQELFLFVFVINWPDLQFFKVQRNSNIKWIPNVFIDTKLHVGNDILAIEHNYNQIRIKNQIFLNQFMDFTKATSIIDLLTETQEFNFKISEQEREVIRTKNNSITIGRSGTGKTICQVLRIFTIQTFYILKMHISDLQEENILINTYQKGAIGLRCVFTTMNPVLVGEVRKYYQKLQNIIQIRQSAQDQILLMIMQDISQYKPYKNLQNQRFNNLVDQVEIDNIQKISDLKENHFPAFLTIQKLLIMIDGSLKKPFFKHDQFQKDFKRTGRAGWDDGQSINISQEVKSMNSFGQSLLDCSNLSIQSISKTSTSNKNIQIIQVDYQYFKTRFWPSAKKMHAYTEDNTGFMNLVWTQIYSIIKGSQYSHTYPDNAIPKCIYLRENKDIYEQSTLNTIYDYYLLYEQWKKEKQLFDQMDLVNYLMNQIDAGDYVGTPIHYLTVDEIQDLPHALIELLSKITEQSLQLCGDTAQNIVQGVGFRFQDLKNNFKNQIQAGETKFLKFDFYQLTVNFRAHNNLLQLANNVVSLLEIFFPKSIDRLHKEVSSTPGPKPYVIESQDEKELISFLGKLFNSKQNKQNKQNEQIEFGCNQVILVKNDQTQKKVPKQLQDALILTVQESKGLEFDDVILYNFFTDDALSCEKWNIINHLFIEEEVLSTSESNQNNLEGCNLTCFQGSEGILIRKLRTKPSFKALDITFYNELCAELKMLYVAVTRSRQRLIIFDSDTSRRVVISDLWKGLGLIDTKLVIVANPSENTSIEQSSREEWAKTGENMFNNKYYEQAAKCFKMAKKETEQIKSQAFADATKAQQLQQEYENENLNKKGYNKGKNDMKENYIQGFISAAINFDKIQMIKHSADCYFSAQDYKNSLIQYIKCQSWIEAAESAEIDKKWLISGILYLKTESYEEGLKNIEKTENYLHVMSALLISRLYLPENQLKEKLCEYFPKVLKHLESELKDNGNKEQQMRLCLNQIKVISENCQNYKNEFDEIVSQFENSPIVMSNREALFKQINSYVQQLFYIFLDIIQNENIQYDVERYINSMQQDDDNQDKINFIIDILQYFNQKNLLKIYFSFYQLKNVEKLIISEIFEDKLIYQLQICNNYIQITNQIQRKLLSPRDIQKAEQTARDSIQDISIILQHQEKDVRINFNFNLLVLGFYKQFKYQLVQWINNQLINGKANTQDLFEACFLFRNFEPPFDSNIHILTSEDKELLKLINQQKQKNIEFNLLEFQKNIKDIDDRSSIVYSDNQYIAKAFYLIKLIYQCVEGNIDLFNSLINLNQRDAQKFIFFTKLCSKIFEYNTLIPHQRQIFLAMCLQFGIGIPISSSFQNLGQSFIFFNQDSFFNTSDKYKIDISECYCLSFDGKTTIISTQLILKQLKLYFKRFHDNYLNTYIKIQEKANSQYLINLYALVIIKKYNKNKYINTKLSQDFEYSFFLEIALSKLIKYKTFQVTPLNDKPRKEITFIYVIEAMKYFNKALVSVDKLKMHKQLQIGFQILNNIHCQAYSIKILNQLKLQPFIVEKEYFSQSEDYVNYLQSINYCYSIEQAQKAINYYNYLLKDYYQQSVQLKDLYIICLTIIFSMNQIHINNQMQYTINLPQSIIEIIKLKLIKRIRQKVRDDKQQKQVQTLEPECQSSSEQQQKQNQLDELRLQIQVLEYKPKIFSIKQMTDQEIIKQYQIEDNHQFILQFIQFLLKHFIQINDNYEKIFLIILTLLSNISIIFKQTNIHQQNLYISIEEIINKNIELTKSERKSKLLFELYQSFKNKTYDWLQFQEFEQYQLYQIAINSVQIERYQLNDYLDKQLSQNENFEIIQCQEIKEHIKMKFANPYLAYRLILKFKTKLKYFSYEILQRREISNIYHKIDQIRKYINILINNRKLVRLLYSEIIQNTINYHSILQELQYLAQVENDADRFVNNILDQNQGENQQIINIVSSDLKYHEDEIDRWKKKGKSVNRFFNQYIQQDDLKSTCVK